MLFPFRYFKNHVVPVNSKVKIVKRKGRITVLCCKMPFMQYGEKDPISQKIAMLQLCLNGFANQKQIAQSFGVHPNTISNLVRSYERRGDLSFLETKKGPKDARILTPAVRRIIYEEAVLSQGKLSENELSQIVSARVGEPISQKSIGRVLEEGGFKKQAETNSSYAQIEFDFVQEKENKQLELNFGPSLSSSFSPAVNRIFPSQKDTAPLTKDPICLNRIDQFYLKRLSKSCICQYGGILIYNHLIEKLEFGSLMEKYLSSLNTRKVSSKEICYSLLYGALLGVRSIEALDRFFKKDFGILLGRATSFSAKTYRKFFDDISSQNKTEEIMLSFAQRFLKCKIVQIGIFYFDGHFIPYHGLENLTKGFYTTIRLAMKGNLHYFVNDKELSEASFIGMRNDGALDQDPLDKHIYDNLAIGDYGRKAFFLAFQMTS